MSGLTRYSRLLGDLSASRGKIGMNSPDWQALFSAVCDRGQAAFEWGFIEPWIHAELYTELKRQAASNGWEPFPIEVPYVTAYPVRLPRKESRDWRKDGGVKWADLCLRSKEANTWYWIEFKVRNARFERGIQKLALAARDAFRKDIVALMGFDINSTADIWTNLDTYTVAYGEFLTPHAGSIRSRKHRFAAAFLQLWGKLDLALWSENTLLQEIDNWFSYRNAGTGRHDTCPQIPVQSFVIGGHSLVVCEWTAVGRSTP